MAREQPPRTRPRTHRHLHQRAVLGGRVRPAVHGAAHAQKVAGIVGGGGVHLPHAHPHRGAAGIQSPPGVAVGAVVQRARTLVTHHHLPRHRQVHPHFGRTGQHQRANAHGRGGGSGGAQLPYKRALHGTCHPRVRFQHLDQPAARVWVRAHIHLLWLLLLRPCRLLLLLLLP